MDSIAQIKKAILHVEEMLYERIPIQELAHNVFASRFHFHRLFRKVTGTSVHQYILCRKLTEAAKLLLETDKPIGVIAAAVGFEYQDEHFLSPEISPRMVLISKNGWDRHE